MDRLEAFEQIDPDPLDRIREVLKLGFAAVCAVAGLGGANINPDDLDPVTKKNPPATGPVNQDQVVEIVAAHYGAAMRK